MSQPADPDADADNAVDDDPPRWGLGHAIVGYVVAYLLAGVFVGVYASLADLREGDRSLGLAIASLLGLWTGMAGAVWLAARRGTGSLVREFGLSFRWSDLPIGAAAGVLSQLVLVPLLYLPFQWNDPTLNERLQEPAEELTDLAHGPAFLLLAVLITVGAPLVEELFFRGVLQQSLIRRIGQPVLAVGITALAFGLAHYQPLQLLGLIAFGVVLGLLAWRTGRLGPGIVAHVFFNLVTVVALWSAR
jgi:membrane protease YdiL (CAAX protease family)